MKINKTAAYEPIDSESSLFFSDDFGLYSEFGFEIVKYLTDAKTARKKLNNQAYFIIGASFNLE